MARLPVSRSSPPSSGDDAGARARRSAWSRRPCNPACRCPTLPVVTAWHRACCSPGSGGCWKVASRRHGEGPREAGAAARAPARSQDARERDLEGSPRAGAAKKTALAAQLLGRGRFAMKAVADTLGIARPNLADRVKRGGSRPRSPYPKVGDAELLVELRRFLDLRPTYGYRRLTRAFSIGNAGPPASPWSTPSACFVSCEPMDVNG